MSAQFILVTLGTPGDVLPYLGVGLALRSRGHEVVVLASERFRGETLGAGLGFEALGTLSDYERFVRTPGLWDPVRCIEVGFDALVRPRLEPCYRLIERLHRPGRTVLACSSFVFSGRIAAEKLGIPLVSVTLQPCSLFRDDVPARSRAERLLEAVAGRRGRRLFRRLRTRRLDRLLDWVNEFRGSLGLSRATDIFYTWRYSPQGLLGLWPAAFFDGATTAPLEPYQAGFVTYEGSMHRGADWRAALSRAGDERPIVFTCGTGMVQGARFFHAAAEACARLGRPGLLLTPHPEQLPRPLPPGVAHVDRAPFSALLPHAAAFVHHGGIGSMARGILAAVPQLIVPQAFDQFDNAALAHKIGVGEALAPSRLTPRDLARSIDELVSSTAVAERCRHWAGRLSGHDPLDGICRYLEARIGLEFASRPSAP